MHVLTLLESLLDNIVFKKEYNISPVVYKNSGFLDYKIYAIDTKTKEEVAKLRISYIPKESFQRLYHDPLMFKLRIGGWNIPKLLDNYFNVESLSKNDLLDILDKIVEYSKGKFKYHIDDDSKEILIKKFNHIKDKLNKLFLKEYKSFKHINLDRPSVRGVKVLSPYKGLGLRLELYKIATAIIKNKGLKLFLGDIDKNKLISDKNIKSDTRSLETTDQGLLTPRHYLDF